MKKHKLSAEEAIQVADLVELPGWKHIDRRIRETIEDKRDDLELGSFVNVHATRGEIAGLRTALDIPAFLVAEAQKRQQ